MKKDHPRVPINIQTKAKISKSQMYVFPTLLGTTEVLLDPRQL